MRFSYLLSNQINCFHLYHFTKLSSIDRIHWLLRDIKQLASIIGYTLYSTQFINIPTFQDIINKCWYFSGYQFILCLLWLSMHFLRDGFSNLLIMFHVEHLAIMLITLLPPVGLTLHTELSIIIDYIMPSQPKNELNSYIKV